MRKIIFAVTTDLNYDQRMQRIGTSLTKDGYCVVLVGRRWATSKPLQNQVYTQHRLNCFFTKGKLFYFEYTLRLMWYLAFRTFDAYGAVDLDTALPVYLKAKLTNRPFIYDAHEYFSEMAEVVNRPIIKKIWTRLEAFIIPRTHFAYTVNASLANIFYRKYKTEFAVIRNCPLLDTKPISAKVFAEPFLLYQGAVNAGRGLEVLLRAMPLLDIKLVICGKGDMFAALQELCCELNLTNKVFFKGYVLPAELKILTQQAFLGINLLENRGLSYYYSLGNKFFDYLHAGIPQLLVNFPEYRYLNDRYHVATMVALEPDTIAAAVTYLLEHTNDYKQLVKNCWRAREELNWQNEEKKLSALYQNLWKNHRQ